MEIRKLFENIKRWLLLVAVVTLSSVIAAVLISFFFIDTVYEATATVLISSPSTDNGVNEEADESLVTTYFNLVQSDLILQQTINKLNLNIDVDTLRAAIKVETVTDTGFIKITAGSRQPEAAREIANTLVGNLQSEAANISLTGRVTVIDDARSPAHPERPNVFLNVFIAAVAGLMIGITLAVFLENMDDTVKDIHIWVKDRCLPCIGAVPDFSEPPLDDTLTDADDIKHNEESYKMIRTEVNSLCSANSCKAILVTSPGFSEGKTVTAANLAVSFGQMGKKVLLIDCNLRNPDLHTVFHLENHKGLAWLLTQEDKIPGVIRNVHERNLDVIVCGQKPDNPTELLESQGLSSIIEYGKSNYDIVILDGPPVLSFADTSIIAKQVDTAILVVSYRKTAVHCVEEAYESLTHTGVSLLGVIVNKMHFIS